ncbi:MAG: Fe-S cluster assembly protein SufD [Pirellulales bacterium]
MSTATTAGGFTQEAFETFLSTRDEPAWLTDLRRDAWQQFLQLPMPSHEDDAWSRTDIRLLRLEQFSLCSSPAEPSPRPAPLLSDGVELGGRLVSVASRPNHIELDRRWADQGVLFDSLERCALSHGDLLRPWLERGIVDPKRDRFSALSAACWSGGAVLYVPRGVVIDQPLHLEALLPDAGTDLGRTLVVLEEGAEVTLLDEANSVTEAGSGLHCGIVELAVGPAARLRYVNLQNWGSRVWHFSHQTATVDRDAQLQWTIGALGSRLAKVDQYVRLIREGAAAQVNGVMFTEGRQHLAYHTLQHHAAASCRSDLLYKAALQDESRTVWQGMIRVDPEAQRTNGYQRNDNLMLSAHARADSIPGLEIEADDVRCTHGSTSGRIDDEQIFYCQSRGLTRNEATRMIVTGFFQQVFDRITIESVREALGAAIRKRIRQYD